MTRHSVGGPATKTARSTPRQEAIFVNGPQGNKKTQPLLYADFAKGKETNSDIFFPQPNKDFFESSHGRNYSPLTTIFYVGLFAFSPTG
ncbi:MAG: hypothetical protein JW849_11200 [Phycisphaerae bacterium]|nr:hypothetical protein [Phycisphaerae bacterium]